MCLLSKWLQRSCTRRPARRAAFRPAMEGLEDRALPSITPVVNLDHLTVTVRVRGDDQGIVHNDIFELRNRPDNGQFQIRQLVGKTVIASADVPAFVNRIDIDGLRGTDTILVNALPS